MRLLCLRLLGRPASESGTLGHVDGAHGRGDCLRGAFMLPIIIRYLIEASDLNDAIRVASKIPPARPGCIEVWPIMPLTHS